MKLLIITSRFPYPLDKGDKLRAFYQIKFLAKRHDVHLICLTEKDISTEHLQMVKQYCSTVNVYKLSRLRLMTNLFLGLFSKKPIQVSYFYQRKIHSKIHKLTRQISPDHIYCQLVRCAEYVKDEFDIKKTIDYMDTLSKGIDRRIDTSKWPFKPLFKVESNRLKIYESLMFEYFDKHTIISYQDREFIYNEQRDKIRIISNGIDTNFFKPIDAKKKYTLLFNGNMNYDPNVLGAIYLAKKILPLVHKKYPDVTLLISGTTPKKEVKDLATNTKVTVSGWMDDIRDAYASADIFIAPMQIGTGLQNKLLEAMSMKIPCITSKLANNALKAEPNEEILIGNEDQEYADLIIRLIEDEDLKHKIAENGYKYVVKKFNWEASVNKLNELIQE